MTPASPPATASAPAPGAALDVLVRRTDLADAGAQNNLGVALLAQGDRGRAAVAFSRALALDPQMTVARRNRATLDGPAGHAHRVDALRARLRLDATDADARRALVDALIDGGDAEAARRELDLLDARRPRDLGALVHRALCEQRLGDHDAATAALDAALALAPGAVVPRLLLGELLYQRGDPERAIVALDEACALAPDYAEAHHARGFVLGELGRVEEATAARERAVALNGVFGRAAPSLSVAPSESAVRHREPSPSSRAPSHEDTHLALGAAFRAKGLYEEAVREYRRAVGNASCGAHAARALGELYLLLSRPAEAAEWWRALTDARPDDASAWHGAAVAAHLAGRLDDADAAYARAASLASDDRARAAVANDHAVLHVARGDATSALGALRAVVDATGAQGSDAPTVARLNYAQLLVTAGDVTGALHQYHAAVAHAPHDAEAWAGLGALLASAGREREARLALARALDADPERADVRYELGFLAESCGEHETARREAEAGMARSPYVARRALRLAIDLGGATLASTVPLDATADTVDGFRLADDALGALLGTLLAPSDVVDAAAASARSADVYAVANELLHAGLHQRAIGAASAALARGGDRVAGLVLLGDAFAAQGFFGEALERYHEARQHDASSVAARVGELRMLRETGRRDAARDAARTLVTTAQHDASVVALAALVHADAGEEDVARALLARACASAGAPADWVGIGDAWRALGEHAREADAYAAACRADAPNVAWRLASARAHRAAARDELARALFGALADDGNVPARLDLADMHVAEGATLAARRLLVDVLTDDPLHVDALASLGALLVEEERYDDARRAVARARRLDSTHPLALAVDGDLHARAGAGDAAAARWARAVALEPASAGAQRARASLACRTVSSGAAA